MPENQPNIPDSELDVLKVLWQRKQATVRQVLDTLKEAGRNWSYATVATLLDRLEGKGFVASDRRDLAFIYRPLVSEQEVRQRRVSNLVEKLYEGEPGLLVLHLLKAHRLEPSRAREIHAILEAMTTEATSRVEQKLVSKSNPKPLDRDGNLPPV
jgi:BlaI family transcriptional regulator, penicillinase repressor